MTTRETQNLPPDDNGIHPGGRRSSRRVPWVEFAVALCILLAIAIASDNVTARLADAQYWVTHTHEVETGIERVRAELLAAGDARQVYIIAGDTTALSDYNASKAAIPAELASLERLTVDNPGQQTNLANLRQAVGKRLGVLQQSIDLRTGSADDAAQQRQWTLDGRAAEHDALTILDRMQDEEERLMTVRQTISSTTYLRVRIVLLISFAIVLLLLAINFYDLSRELRERRAAEETVSKLNGRVLRVQDEERRRVARELHDSIGQTFAVLKMNLEVVARNLTSPEQAGMRELLAESASTLETGLSEVRTLSHLLHPPLLDEMGFASAARWLADGFSQRSKIQVKLEVPENLARMSQDVELALFRVLQEGLTNVHKHSESQTVEISLSRDSSSVRLSLKDFGKGVPGDIAQSFARGGPGLGVGLSGMKERMRDLGGRLNLSSNGTGTLLEATVPLTASTLEPN
jgi:signal transduction histidine kinase